MAKYLIGIDLGTTNSTLAYKELKGDEEIIHFEVEQRVAIDQMQALKTLPSFLYFFMPEEGEGYTAGHYAKKRAVEAPGRTVASAKSWLSHKGIDLHEKILPWQSDLEEKISPIQALSAYLDHFKTCWDEAFPEAPFCSQKVSVTVPASFDPVCRQLVQEALTLSDYPETTLLEEPQAAFYSWLYRHEENWRDHLTVGDTILVVDIGGGTTDFCLISVDEEEGNFALKRIAVGEHLLLGGDNMDLALAHLAKRKLEEGGQLLDAWQLHQLALACREAKEALLAEEAPEKREVTIAGRGSSLIGGSLSVELTREEVERFITNGFFPLASFDEEPKEKTVSGIAEVGLPYAKDARISTHLSAFLKQAKRLEPSFSLPTHVLFNGGTMKGEALRKRVSEQFKAWAKELKGEEPRLLGGEDLDFAVSQGAVYAALAKEGKGLRIKAGLSHTYYVGVEEAAMAIPGLEPQIKAVCVAPAGLEEGDEIELSGEVFTLLVGEHAQFQFFSTPDPTLPSGELVQAGETYPSWEGKLSPLPPIEAFLEKSGDEMRTVRVKIKARLTELGVLELFCVSDKKEWKLELNARKQEETTALC